MSFTNKVVIVTGSSSGIGRDCAVLFAMEGAAVTIHGQSEERLKVRNNRRVEEGERQHRLENPQSNRTDRKEETQKKLVDETVKKFGRLDVLVNNAGLSHRSDLGNPSSLENLDYVMSVNVKSLIAMTRLAVPQLQKTIGNVRSSILSFHSLLAFWVVVFVRISLVNRDCLIVEHLYGHLTAPSLFISLLTLSNFRNHSFPSLSLRVRAGMSDCKTKFTLDETVEVFLPPEALRVGAHVKDLPGYHQLYDRSTRNADEFWLEAARDLFFEKFSDRGLEYNFDVRKGPIYTRFLSASKTNISYNCLERAIANGLGNKVAYKWVANEPGDEKTITYQELYDQVIVFSTVLRSKGVYKGDVVAIYLPMILELPVAMLSCARIGAPQSVIFAGFSAESLAQRIQQANAQVLITADAFCRGPKLIHLKALADRALAICEQSGHSIRSQIAVEHARRVRLPNGVSLPQIQWNSVDAKWAEEMEKFAGVDTPVEWMEAEDQLFVLYTSGSTGVPKGIVHPTAGYMVYTYMTCKLTFDAQKDMFFGALRIAGIPTYPTAARTWQMVQEHKVTKLYTSPTAIRCLMGSPQEMVTDYDRSSLKVIGTVEEPINPKAWLWLHDVVGEGKAAIVDTYWQTETGGHVITALPAATPTKPGSATLPFPGVRPVLVDHDGAVIEGPGEGNLCFASPWPSISRTVLGDHERFEKTYFKSFPGFCFTGDGAKRDEDGYFWVTGRVDDLVNVSGHLLSTAEIESPLAAHPDVVGAAVVAAEHEIKGHFPYAFVVVRKANKQLTDALVNQLKLLVREKIGPIAVPDEVQLAPGLPKTRSGKVTRRILRKIAEGDKAADLGDTSTLIDSTVIEELWIARVPSRNG